MWITILIAFILIVAVFIFLNLPITRTKSEFEHVIKSKISNAAEITDVFTEEDIKKLPSPVQKYFKYTRLLEKPKMTYMKATFKKVDFKISENKIIKIDYTQFNFVEKPERFAYIDSSLYGIPFEGIDSYQNGVGSMKGTIAKMLTIFNQRGESMDKACLVTILSESLIIPNVALQDYIQWEELDETHAKATITYYGISASGIFTFDRNGAMVSFDTKDRPATDMKGFTREAEWSAVIRDYQTVNGIKQPRVMQAIWHYPEGDSIYFNDNKSDVIIEFK